MIRKFIPFLLRTEGNLIVISPDGNFLIDHHPAYKGLFIATGGSGHGFKFFPVLGEKIVDAIQGTLDTNLREIWQWRRQAESDVFCCADGSRGGKKGLMLQ